MPNRSSLKLPTLHRLPVWLLSLLIVWAYLRGFALFMEPYALGQYLYTYEEGFLIRGFLGSLFEFIGGPEPMAVRAIAEEFSTWFYFLFIATLIGTFIKLRPNEPPSTHPDSTSFANLLFLVLLSGPLLVGIGATRGFFDTYILTLALLAYLAFVHHRLILAFLLTSLATLIHEQVAFTVLPMMGWVAWNRGIAEHSSPVSNKTLLQDGLLLVSLVMVILVVVRFGEGTSDQQLLIIDKVRKALETGYLEAWADPYFTVFAAHNSAGFNFGWENFRRLGFDSHQTMLTPSVVFLIIGLSILLLAQRWLSALVFVIATLLPISILFFAMDAHRYLFHIQLTGFFLLLETLRMSPEAVSVTRKAFTPVLIILGLWQISITDYKVVEYNARNHTPLYELMRTYYGEDAVPRSRVWRWHI